MLALRIFPGFIPFLLSMDCPAKKLRSPNSSFMSGLVSPFTKILHMVGGAIISPVPSLLPI